MGIFDDKPAVKTLHSILNDAAAAVNSSAHKAKAASEADLQYVSEVKKFLTTQNFSAQDKVEALKTAFGAKLEIIGHVLTDSILNGPQPSMSKLHLIESAFPKTMTSTEREVYASKARNLGTKSAAALHQPFANGPAIS